MPCVMAFTLSLVLTVWRRCVFDQLGNDSDRSSVANFAPFCCGGGGGGGGGSWRLEQYGKTPGCERHSSCTIDCVTEAKYYRKSAKILYLSFC